MPSLTLSAASVFSWSLEASGLPLADAVAVTLAGGGAPPAGPLTLTLAATPAATAPWRKTLDGLAPGATQRVDARDLRLDPGFLAALRERQTVTLEATLTDAAGQTLAHARHEAALLPAGQWTGVNALPESLACFVTPDHPALADLLKEASAQLQKATGDGALDGYLSGSPDRALSIAAALHAALAARKLTYLVPPPSFEAQGQKVRLPHETLGEGLGCCLDTAVLWAALLERAGLGVLLPMDRTHAWVGFWLTDRRLGETVVQDPERLRNFVRMGEAMVLETTLHGGSFDEACRAGQARLENPQPPFAALELASARLAGFRPLPLETEPKKAQVAGAAQPMSVPAPLPRAEPLAPAKKEDAQPRLERWKRRLLDLSLRNRMLNFRDSSATLRLLPPGLSQLEDALADETTLTLRPLPKVRKSKETPAEQAGPPAELLADEFKRRRCLVDCDEDALDLRGTRIHREAATLEQETGSNSLYLALGLVAWRETKTTDKPRLAPLLLLPVAFTRLPRGTGFELEIGDDEPRVNATLVEFLRAQFNLDLSALAGELPQDGSGLDLPRIFAHARQAISGMAGWELREEAWLGFFSFQKHLLWEELSRPDSPVLHHPVVRGVLSRQAPETHVGGPLPAPETMDAALPSLCAPMPADSSQLAAVCAAGQGRTFVLEGPPGTGKSQTITNLVTHALAAGKRVLFVAEKNAALSVVQRRLDSVGLAPWCLEMHARKADKKEVVRQLQLALEEAEKAAPPSRGAKEAADKTDAARKELEAFAAELHAPRAGGWSLYDCVERLARLGDGPASGDTLPGDLAPDKRKDMEALLDEADAAWPGLPELAGHPLADLRCTSMPPLALLDEVAAALDAAEAAFAALAQASGESAQAMPALGALADQVAHIKRKMTEVPEALWRGENPPTAEAFRAIGAWRTETAKTLNLAVLDQDVTGAHADLRASQSSWFLPAWLGRRRAANFLDFHKRAPLPATGAGLLALFEGLAQAKENHRATALAACGGDETIAKRLLADPEKAATLAEEGARLRRILPAFDAAAAAADTLGRKLEELGATWDPQPAPNPRSAPAALRERLQAWKANAGALPGWCAWQRLRARLVEARLPMLVAGLEAGRLKPGTLRAAAERSLCAALADSARAASPRLAGFFGPEEDRRRANYRKWRDALREACADFASQKVAARAKEAVANPAFKQELAVLRHQMGLSRRHWPARKLAEAMPGLLCALKPCFLMSPQSVAQHLPRGLPPFDLVVFDEASQIPPWDAVGSLARGNAAVVVGDSKQLPPTSFFAKQEEEEAQVDAKAVADNADYEDLESLLDEMHAAGFRASRLSWHYRSRSEDLIAFSNARYYDGKLFTFPAAGNKPALRLTKVEGTYDRAATRTCRAEAEAVVADILERVKKASTTLSLGVVTFSQAQQDLILDLLDQAARGNPELEALMSPAHPDPLIVKNLENIQGDERDVILFSIGYGPDASGKFAMNFGPLNKQGGQRRLNVAITRARKEITVYSIIGPHQIDPTRTSAQGVRDLRDFLAYAEARSTGAPDKPAPADAVEEAIAQGLEARGWKVVRHAGQGGWKMPLAVMHPDKPGTCVLGILTDGPAADRAPAVFDRECVRPDMLASLGWKTVRASCLEFMADKAGLIARLDGAARGS